MALQQRAKDGIVSEHILAGVGHHFLQGVLGGQGAVFGHCIVDQFLQGLGVDTVVCGLFHFDYDRAFDRRRRHYCSSPKIDFHEGGSLDFIAAICILL